MLPALAKNDAADCVGPHAEVACESVRCLAGCGAAANVTDLFGCEFRGTGFFAANLVSPAFGVAVGVVVGITAEKKMIWPEAVPNVAAMQNAHVFGDGSVMQLPGNAMGRYSAAIYPDICIAIGPCAPGPQPAPIGFRYVLPEPFGNRNGRTRGEVGVETTATVGAIMPMSVCNLGRSGVERPAAVAAEGVRLTRHGKITPFRVQRQGAFAASPPHLFYRAGRVEAWEDPANLPS